MEGFSAEWWQAEFNTVVELLARVQDERGEALAVLRDLVAGVDRGLFYAPPNIVARARQLVAGETP
jgi:hypothetical protein